ncbi:MAG: prepilin peptidase [Patescibacteria group bacterium]|nr:prepilin peptidase [Patescibacteria group bacterium]
MIEVLEISVFLIGISIGSFLNVLIDRIPREESIIRGRSYCERCKKKLTWKDLIPVVSFILLKGKCRYCHSPISWYYPIVELITGILFILVFNVQLIQNSQSLISQTAIISLIYYLFISSSLIVIFFTDLKYGIIPDKILYPTIGVSLLFQILNTRYLIPNTISSAIGAFLFFLLLFLITKGKGMGFGDVKFVFFMGLFLGFPKILSAFYVAFLTGAVVSLILILWGKKRFFGGTIPFGPFLVFATFVCFFYGEKIIKLLLPGIF